MSESSIARSNLINQVPKEGSDLVKHATLTIFVRDLINENATYQGHEGLSLYVEDLSPSDKKIFLSNILDASEYEWFCKNPMRLEAGFIEYKKHMQEIIDNNIDHVWHDMMQEADVHSGQYSDNGEVYYY